MSSSETDSAGNSAFSVQNDPDLARLVTAWPELLPPIRAGILAMVEAAGGKR